MSSTPRTLVVLIGETRASELTAEGFETNLLAALGADLGLCVRAGEQPNALYDRAKYVWTFEETGDWAAHYDEAANGANWRVLLQVGKEFLGGIEDAEYPQVGSMALLYYYRRLLWRSIEAAGIADAYDWIVLTRSDLMWPAPHPDVRYLSTRHIYVFDGEQYGGVSDRHIVVPRRYFEPVLSGLVDPIFTDPATLKDRIDSVCAEQGWFLVNIERLLALRLRDLGLWRRVRYLPYIPFAVRAPGGPTTWSTGAFDEELGYYVKYPTERERSEIAQRFVSDQESWRRYLLPVRGALRRHRLRKAYRERGLYERTFRRRDPLVRRYRTGLSAVAGSYRRGMASLDRAAARLGRQLRRAPGMPALLDARVRRLRRRAERGQG